MTTPTLAKSVILLAILLISVPAAAGQLVSASLKNGDYGTGPAGPGTAVAPTSGVVNTADGVLFIATEAGGRSNGLINWQIGNNFQWRRTGTITFLFKATRGQLTAGQIVCDNRGFGTFRNGQATFSVDAVPAANGPGAEDDRVTIAWRTWHNNVWYGHATTQIEYDRWYSLGFAWGGPSEFELWVDQELKSAVNLPAANFPWGTDSGQNGFNMGLGDNHERGVDGYNSSAGVMFANIRMWDEYRDFGDTVGSNHAPTAENDAYEVNENATLTVGPSGVLANDSDQDGDTLESALVSNVANGTLSLAADGSFTYQPNAGYSGTDSFTYRASDGALSSEATVTITIVPVNQPPVANPDAASAASGATIGVDVLANDMDPDGDTLSIVGIGAASIGTVTLEGDGVQYHADVLGGLSPAIAALDGLNHGQRTSLLARLANAQRARERGHLDVAARDLLHVAEALARFASDAAASQIAATIQALLGGTLTDQFSYSISDGQGGTASAQVTITISLQ